VAGYVSLTLRSSDALAGLAPLFAADTFTAVAAGGIAPTPNGRRWFLAGVGLEDFVGRFLERSAEAPADVRLRAAAGDEERGYLESIRDRLARSDSPIAELSPFEQVDERLRATVIDGALDASVLDEIEAWHQDAAGAVVYVYGSIALATADGGGPRPLFRYLFPPGTAQRSIGAPFLLVRAEGGASGSAAVIDAYSSATVWLRDGGALNGLVGDDEADRNLETLAGLAESLAGHPDTQSAQARVDGTIFVGERERLEQRLAPIVGSIEVGG